MKKKKLNRRSIKPWIFSLLLHGLFVASLVLGLRHGEVFDHSRESIQIDVKEIVSPKAVLAKDHSNFSSGKTQNKKNRHLTLKDLLPSMVPSKESDLSSSTSPSETNNDDDGANLLTNAFANGTALSPLYQFIFHSLDEHFDFPEEFVNSQIEGSAKAVLVFSSEGELLKPKCRVESSSNYVKVAVWRVLRRSFQEALPKKLLESKEEITIHADFFMRIIEGRQDIEQQLASGRHMVFSRSRQHSKLQWSLGPFHGLGPLPVVAMNPYWFADMYTKLFTKKGVFDPLSNYREDPDWDD